MPFLPRTIKDVLRALPPLHSSLAKQRRAYTPQEGSHAKLMLAVASMRDHMTSEGWQLQLGLREAGYTLCGNGLEYPERSAAHILKNFSPATVVVQDKREWDGQTQSSRGDRSAFFRDLYALEASTQPFKLTVLKDAHQKPDYHSQSAKEIGAHGWIVYYHPCIVRHLAPYTQEGVLVRTWHSVDAEQVPEYSPLDRRGCLLSGARSRVYPLRERLAKSVTWLPACTLLPHPGYHRGGSATPAYLRELSRYKVAICTSSIYGYALRKIIEATACGCRVLTDLPVDDVLPEIDANLCRIHPDTPLPTITTILNDLIFSYNPEQQADLAQKAKMFYDYRALGLRLDRDIEQVRLSYNQKSV